MSAFVKNGMNLRVASRVFAEALGVRCVFASLFRLRNWAGLRSGFRKRREDARALPKHCVQNDTTQREAPV
jgi:hypothetical protein